MLRKDVGDGVGGQGAAKLLPIALCPLSVVSKPPFGGLHASPPAELMSTGER